MIGLRVGPFEIVEPAEVPEPGDWFYARRSGMSQRRPAEVLVRVLPPDAPPEARVELQRQFENLRQVEHARVPIAVAMYEGIGAMAITAVRGAPLTRVIQGRADDSVPMSPPTLLDLLLDVAEILQYAHHRGRPHGLLGPRHLVLAADGTLWVMGFAAGPEAAPDPEWCPPERAQGEPATEATDQWALAALAAALITGRVPWPGDDPATAADQADIEPIVEPVERQWPALGRLLRKMLDRRPANRYATMHQVRQELLALARRAGGTTGRRDLAALLVGGAQPPEPVEEDVADPPTKPQLGDTLTPPDATDDPEPEPGEESETARRAPPPERPTVDLRWEDDAPEAPATDGRVSPSVAHDPPSDPVEVARSLDSAAPRDRKSTPLPSEQIPMVRPDLVGDVPAAGRTANAPQPLRAPPAPVVEHDVLQELTGPTMLADVMAIAEAAGIDPSAFDVDTSADPGELNVEPHPEHDPKSVSDPPSLPHQLPPDEDEGADDDEEATVVFSPHASDEDLEAVIAAFRSDIPASPTLSPDSDSDHHSEELPSPRPARYPTHGAPTSGDPASEGYLPRNLPSSVGHEPELGSIHANVSIGNEPVPFGDDDGPLPTELPEDRASVAQTVALGAIALMVLVFLAAMVLRFT